VEGVNSPRLITADDILADFNCGVPALNEWLKHRAIPNHLGGASRSYVICRDKTVLGYYCLSAGAVTNASATGSIRRNMPDPIPAIVLGRLAIDLSVKGHGLGAGLLLHAIEQTQVAAKIIGARALLVHAQDQASANFYRHFKFAASTLDEMTLMLRV
jgi:predicted GNAT family N-acyltransferase